MPPPNKTLSLGFIGGSISSAVGYTHFVSCQLDHRWNVVSGCFSRDEQQSHTTAQNWQIPAEKTYSDWRAYIAAEKDNLDAVAVLTPTPDHADIVCTLIENGVPVICEKAMAASLEQSAAIQDALEQHKGFLAMTYNYSGYPLLRVLRKHVQNGDLGTLKQIQIEMPSDGFIQPNDRMAPQQWRLKDGPIPTILLDLAVHLHHLTHFLTGLTPKSVNADFHHDSTFQGIIDDAYLWVKYNQDFRASMWVSKTALGYRNGLKLRLFGDHASAEWLQENPERLHIYQKDTTCTTYDRGNCRHPEEIRERFKPGHPGGFVEAFANLYNDIADALMDFREDGQHASPYVFGWNHADQGLRLLYGASQANTERAWQSLTEGEPT